jgi:hypothetical protein
MALQEAAAVAANGAGLVQQQAAADIPAEDGAAADMPLQAPAAAAAAAAAAALMPVASNVERPCKR